jgi:hypothetical protein
MAIPNAILGSWERGGKASQPVSEFDRFAKKVSEAIGDSGRSVVEAVRAIPQTKVEIPQVVAGKPVAYKSIVTKRDDQGRILEITHEPI